MIAFLILHYKNAKETIECVDSIRKLNYPMSDVRIFIVDNGSNDESTETLRKEYSADGQIEVFFLKENIGFSGGNNFGFSKIRNNKNVKFAVVCNSDIVFTQADFINRVIDAYKLKEFDVLGPDIYKIKKGKKVSTSPMYAKIASLKALEETETIFTCRLNRIMAGETSWMRIKLAAPSFPIACKYGISCLKRKISETYSGLSQKRKENVILQGACFVFSPRYICSHDTLFYPETFLYYEEVILFVRAQKEGLILMYDPSLQVWHKEGKSTDIGEEKIQRQKKFLKNRLEALKICRNYLLNNMKNT